MYFKIQLLIVSGVNSLLSALENVGIISTLLILISYSPNIFLEDYYIHYCYATLTCSLFQRGFRVHNWVYHLRFVTQLKKQTEDHIMTGFSIANMHYNTE